MSNSRVNSECNDSQGMATDRYYTMPPAKINPRVKKGRKTLRPYYIYNFCVDIKLG